MSCFDIHLALLPRAFAGAIPWNIGVLPPSDRCRENIKLPHTFRRLTFSTVPILSQRMAFGVAQHGCMTFDDFCWASRGIQGPLLFSFDVLYFGVPALRGGGFSC